MIASRARARAVVLRRGPVTLYRYGGGAGGALPLPVVLVPSIINRARILDLREGQSVAGHLVDAGLQVYLVDWGTPRPADAGLGLDDYAVRLLRRVLEAVLHESGAPRAHLFGYCLGGVFSLVAATRFPQVASVCALTTPVDLTEPGPLGVLTDPRLLDVDRLTAAHRVVPGGLLWAAFQALDPVGIASKWRAYAERDDPEWRARFRAQESWLGDPVPMTGRALRDVVQKLYRENGLARGTLELCGRRVDLSEGRAPVLNLIAERDSLVPPGSSRALEALWGGPVTTRTFSGGHIGVTVGRRAPQGMWAAATEWLLDHQETP